MFRSPDWALWQNPHPRPGHEIDRAQMWAANGVDVVRLQVVDAESIKEPAGPLNYLLT